MGNIRNILGKLFQPIDLAQMQDQCQDDRHGESGGNGIQRDLQRIANILLPAVVVKEGFKVFQTYEFTAPDTVSGFVILEGDLQTVHG